MGNTASTTESISAPPTPSSAFFNLANPPILRQRSRKQDIQPPVAYPRRSIFHPDEDEPDDFEDNPHEGVLVGWTRTEQGFVIPQIRSIPHSTPFDDTIFSLDDQILNSPRLPWVEKRSRSPVPSARSIPRMRQFSIESFREVRRELRVVNESRPTTATSERGRSPLKWSHCEEVDEGYADDSESESFGWQTYTDRDGGFEGVNRERQSLKRSYSTNDSGYSTMAHTDTWSCSDTSEEPYGWEQAAGYITTTQSEIESTQPIPKTTPIITKIMPPEEVKYLYEQRQESAYISKLLRDHPFDEWTEWRTTVTNLLMIPEEEEIKITPPPVPPKTPSTPPPTAVTVEIPRSPTRRKSLFNFALLNKNPIHKRKSLLW